MKIRTLNPATKAALPGKLAVSRRKYAEYYAHGSRSWLSLYLSTFLPKLRGSTCAMHWVRACEHLQHGCLCPSVILDEEASLVATFVNLYAAGEGSEPVIKVHREPLDMLPKERRATGTRLASAAIFYRTEESWRRSCWNDFAPIPVECLVEDIGACGHARNRLSDLAWKALEMGVAQVGKRREEGLYRVDIPHDIVWNAF